MSGTAKLTITANDQASATIKSIQGKLGGLGKSVTAIKWLALGKMAGDALREMGEAAGKSGGKAAASFTDLQDVFTGLQAKLVGTVLENDELMESVKNLVAALIPLVTTFLNALLPVLSTLINSLLKVYSALRPVIETILSYAIPAFQKLGTIMKIAANGFLIIKAAMTGNREEVKRLTDENKLLGKSLTEFKPIKVNLTPASTTELAAVGAKIRMGVSKGVTAKDKEIDPKKEMSGLFDNLLTLKEANRASGDELTKLNGLYATYKMVIDDASKSLEDRTDALAKVAKFDSEAENRIKATSDALKEQSDVLAENINKHEARISALVSLQRMGRANAGDVAELENEQASIGAILSSNNVGVEERAALETRFAELTDLFTVKAEAFNQVVFDFGGVLSDSFTSMFSGDGLFGGIQNFFANAIGEIGNGFRAFTMTWATKQAAFVSFQAKIYAFYGKLMTGLAKLLGNPFTAGFAALGIAAGLSAMSRKLGGAGGGVGGGVGGSVSASTFGNAQREIALNGTGNITINFPDGLVDMSNASTQRQFTKLINDVVGNRGTNLVGA